MTNRNASPPHSGLFNISNPPFTTTEILHFRSTIDRLVAKNRKLIYSLVFTTVATALLSSWAFLTLDWEDDVTVVLTFACLIFVVFPLGMNWLKALPIHHELKAMATGLSDLTEEEELEFEPLEKAIMKDGSMTYERCSTRKRVFYELESMRACSGSGRMKESSGGEEHAG